MSLPARTTGEPPVSELPLVSGQRYLRGERVLKELAYVAIGIPLGTAYLVLLLAGLVLGTLLAPFWIGLPLLLASSEALWSCAALERRLANRLLDTRIPPLPRLPGAHGGIAGPVRQRLGRRSFWRAVALLALRLPVSGIAVVVVAVGVGVTVSLLFTGVRGITGAETGYLGPFAIAPGLGVAICLLALPVAVLTVAVTDWIALPLRTLARALLVTNLPAGAPVRETLAQSLGDRTLAIAYWLPERETFVDERGRPVPLPEPETDRAWTAVDYNGRRVAAIIHDASLEASPELVQAAAAAASLALDNERLKAELRARVEELRASRVRIVEASNTARRRIERNLHDGAQQQLVALAVDLRLLRSRVGSNPEANEMIDQIESKLSTAISELQELARGIHPGILTDRGLAPALESLAARAPIAVATEIELPERPSRSVEAVAYFVIAEALTNVLKYAQAEHAAIRARYEDGHVVVEMQDDGVGGADERGGTGLQGLRDRVGALDGELIVVSPDGGGTLVRARIPARADELVEQARAEGLEFG